MSHILDALQKVQDEKAAKLKQSTITGGVLLEAPTNKKPHKNWFLPAGIIVAILLAGALFAKHLGKPSPGSNNSPPVATASRPPEPARLPQPVTPPQLPPPVTPGVIPAPTPVPTTVPSPPASVSAAPAAVPRQPVDEDNEKPSSRRKPQRAHTAASSAVTGVTVQNGLPEGVKLTGIAWQDSKKMRRAVVNEVLVGEGAVIAGAKLLEIRPDTVRFEKNGSLFEATLPR